MVVDRVRRGFRDHPVAYRTARRVWRAFESAKRRLAAVDHPIARLPRALRQRHDLSEQRATWIRAGRPAPAPAAVKQAIVADYARRSGCRCLIETGTYRGDMVAAQLRRFRRIFSIELDDRLFDRAADRFRDERHVVTLRGDSAVVLPTLLESIREPCLFWLDGHYSGGVTARGALETPVVQELEAVLRHPIEDHVVLVDDARCFGEGDYPSLDELRRQVSLARPGWAFEVRDDIIRIHRPDRASLSRAAR